MTDPLSVSPFMRMFVDAPNELEALVRDLRRRAALMKGEYGRIRFDSAERLAQILEDERTQPPTLDAIKEAQRLEAVIYTVDLAESEGVPDDMLLEYLDMLSPVITQQVDNWWGDKPES